MNVVGMSVVMAMRVMVVVIPIHDVQQVKVHADREA
jgi:hypothetical protein